MTRSNTLSRFAGLVVATLVTTLTLAVTARAVQTITTANAALVSYNLAAGAASPAIGLPANQSVLVMGICNTAGVQSVASITVLRVAGAFLAWTGLDSPPGGGITQGFAAAVGVHMVFLDQANQVDIEANGPDTLRVFNGAAAARTGNVTLIW